MLQSRFLLPALLFGLVLPAYFALAVEVPPLDALRKPVEETQEVINDDEPILPSAVSPERLVTDLARLCPEDPVWFITVPDAARLSADWHASTLGQFTNEAAMEKTLRDNRFGLQFLFSDLPSSVIAPVRITAVASVMELANSLARQSQKMAMAAYVDDDGNLDFLFLLDVGSDRVPAFSTIGEWETYFFLANPGSDVLRGNHAGNFLDVWRVKQRAVDAATAEVAAGFAENVAIVSNNAGLAARSMDLLAGGANTADSLWGRRLAASLATSTSTDAIAFLRMDKLLQGLAATPLARQSVVNWADFIGHGGRDGEALYYGLEFTPDGARETYLLPVSAQTVSASLVELLAKRLRPIEGWSTPMVIPYQPNPSMFFAANLEGRQLGGILRQERRLFGSPGSAESFTVPDAARHLFTSDILALLRGEIGLAFFPDGDGQSWLMVLPCSSNPEPAFIRSEMKVERSGVTINSRDANWRENVCWAAISQNIFRRLPGDFLVIASHGDLMLATVDQLFNGSTFTNNKDFARAMADAEGNQGLMLYLNIPEIIVRQYPNLSAIMRSLYPRSSGLNSRPPLAMLRRYARGLMAVIAPMGEGDDFIRVTVQSPAPSLGMVAAGVVLGFPTSLRQDGRQAMEKSRENLQTLWLRLQLYASRYGHFPETLEDLAAEMRAPGVPNEFIRNLFIAPAALSRLNAREAATQSYQYVSGVTPNDEPDLPIVYEAEPWSEEFTGWYPLTGSGRGRSESGDFVPYRQYIRLDGQVVVMTDKSFRERVLPRLVERE